MDPLLLRHVPNLQIGIYRLPVEMIIPLRHKVLCTGLPLESARFNGDTDPATWHIGLFHPGSSCPQDLICCASFMFEPHSGEPAWQLRGMCTEPAHQGRGFGNSLLHVAEKAILADPKGVRLFWCNARSSAFGFYQKNGWFMASNEFEIAGVGPHYKMTKRVT